LKGEKKHAFLCAGLGWVTGTSARRISRLRAEFKNRRTADKTQMIGTSSGAIESRNQEGSISLPMGVMDTPKEDRGSEF